MKQSIKKVSAREACRARPEDQHLRKYVREYCLSGQNSLKDLMDRLEREIIRMVLESSNGSQREAAGILRVRPSTLNYKIRKLGLVHIHRYLTNEGALGPGRPPKAKIEEPRAASFRVRSNYAPRNGLAEGSAAGITSKEGGL